MPERPIILFPSAERADRETKPSAYTRFSTPSVQRQYSRLQPTFQMLRNAFEQKNVRIQSSPTGLNPDFALVFEVAGSVDNFYTAVKYCEGLEWVFDKEENDFVPDDDFYQIDTKSGERLDKITGKAYCIMSNQTALEQMLSLWNRYVSGEEHVFERGFTGLRDVFRRVRSIRKWNAQDRIEETGAVDYWRNALEIVGDEAIPFEIELFYRKNENGRAVAYETIASEVERLEGRVIRNCVIDSIAYHGMLVELPRNEIERLVERYEDVTLTQVDDIMFFRPTCQSMFTSEGDSQEIIDNGDQINTNPQGLPVVAILDGMPMQNHPYLLGRLIVDDPDEYAIGYESRARKHGTSMASLVVHGDISRGFQSVSTPVYMRPILKPKDGYDGVIEQVPSNELFIDILHRAVKRIVEGENGENPVAPSVKVINLSIGDPVRQLGTTMSPMARLIDYLSYKYGILFIISAGNHADAILNTGKTFEELKALSISERSKEIFGAIKANQRNHRVLAPAESINSLTVGAIYDDYSESSENTRMIWAVDRGLPAPYSAIGKGYRSTITPDIFYYGGRKHLRSTMYGVEWVQSQRAPGCKAAAPFGPGDGSGESYTFGTSDAAALITHEALICNDVLNQVFLSESGSGIPQDYQAILLKAMLVHGASWDGIADRLAIATGDSPKKLCKWVGNGIPDIERVCECTKERITLIGTGVLSNDDGDIYKLPLPIDFSSRRIKRKLTVTLAYMSPISPSKNTYRSTQLWFNLDEIGQTLVGERVNTEWQAVKKGTLQHEVFVGESSIVWNEELQIKVNCTKDAENTRVAVPYCLFVTFEIAEGFDIDLYAAVETRIRQRVPIANA